MLIVALGYFYVIAIVAAVAIADGHVWSGLFTLIFAGILPGAMLRWLRQRKRLARQREEMPQDTSGSD
jgi:Flp pilus assembly protein TadB